LAAAADGEEGRQTQESKNAAAADLTCTKMTEHLTMSNLDDLCREDRVQLASVGTRQ